MSAVATMARAADLKVRRTGTAPTRMASTRAAAVLLCGLVVAAAPDTAAQIAPPHTRGASKAAATDTVALVGATVHPVSGPSVSNATIVVRGETILSVGTGPAPTGARVVDLAGKHVYPGYVSADSVIGLTEIGAVDVTNDSREQGNFKPQLLAFSAINPASEHFPVARVNGITTSMSVPARPVCFCLPRRWETGGR